MRESEKRENSAFIDAFFKVLKKMFERKRFRIDNLKTSKKALFDEIHAIVFEDLKTGYKFQIFKLTCKKFCLEWNSPFNGIEIHENPPFLEQV